MSAFGWAVSRLGALRGFCICLIALTAVACSADHTEPQNTNPVAIEVSRYAVTLPPTTDTALTATITGTDINEAITWTSSSPSVATVRDDGPFGVVRAVSEGTTTIYAVRKSNPGVKSPPVTITVVRIPALRGFSVDTTLQQFIKGDSRTFTLTPKVSESRAAVTYAFTSSNTAVATVNATTGLVTAVGAGTATITTAATGAGSGLITNTLSATVQVLVGELQSRFRRITAGARHSCALKLTGEVFCWGANFAGQLGDGTLAARFAPTQVVGAPIFSEISAGFQHSCGLTAAGTVHCWGNNGHGRLGDGTTIDRLVPALAVSPVLFSVLEVGGAHTCAISTNAMTYCWGDNGSGQLGTGIGSLVPAPIKLPGVAIQTISSGLLHSCATSDANVGYCWGNVIVSGRVVPTIVDSGVSIAQYALGQFTKCLLSTAGRLYCPLGNGSQRLVNLPNAGPPFPYVLGVIFRSIVAGDAHSCGITLQNDTYCWGSNVDGRMGNGGIGDGRVPALVSGGHKFAELSAGEAHTCGITATNQVYCWGNNLNGQLGSAGPSSPIPKLVPFIL